MRKLILLAAMAAISVPSAAIAQRQDRRHGRAPVVENRRRRELRRAGKRGRRHDDCGGYAQPGRLREHPEREPEEDRAWDERKRGANAVSHAWRSASLAGHRANVSAP